MFEMFVNQVGVNAIDGHPIVLLKDKEGMQTLPIWIGPAEARSISLALQRAQMDRPQSHDLLIKVFEAVAMRIEKLEITEIANQTFFSRLVCTDGTGKQQFFDCRPSDGIALALRAAAPILVAQSVIDDAGVREEHLSDPTEEEKFKKFIEAVKPADFARLLESRKKKTRKKDKDDSDAGSVNKPDTEQSNDNDQKET